MYNKNQETRKKLCQGAYHCNPNEVAHIELEREEMVHREEMTIIINCGSRYLAMPSFAENTEFFKFPRELKSLVVSLESRQRTQNM